MKDASYICIQFGAYISLLGIQYEPKIQKYTVDHTPMYMVILTYYIGLLHVSALMPSSHTCTSQNILGKDDCKNKLEW
jgi:hypothetical protein